MARFLSAFSGWILAIERVDIADASKTISLADRKDVKTWEDVKLRFDSLFRGGIIFLASVIAYEFATRYLASHLLNALGRRMFINLTIATTFIGVLVGIFLLVRYIRALDFIHRAFRESWSRRTRSDLC